MKRQCLFIVLLFQRNRCQAAQRTGGARRGGETPAEGCFRRFDVAHPPLCDTDVQQGLRAFSGYSETHLKCFDRAAQLAQLQPHIAKPEPRIVSLRMVLQSSRRVEIRCSCGDHSGFREEAPDSRVHFYRRERQSQRFLIRLQRLFKTPELLQYRSHAEERVRRSRIDLCRVRVCIGRFF